MPAVKKPVAALVSDFRRHAHSISSVGKILEGYNHDGGVGPNLRLVSLFVDQAAQRDMNLAEEMAHQFGFTIYDTISDALTLGTGQLAVEGVFSVAEHGSYPTNANGQVLYPKRRFFEEIFKVFENSGRVVPVFNSKHLATTWADAKWIYDRARGLGVPLMAGSVLPVSWRVPAVQFPMNSPLVEAAQIGSGPTEGFGFHALEALQCLAERRQGGETGMAAVQCVQGPTMWEVFDQGNWPRGLIEAALAIEPYHVHGDYREVTSDPKTGAALFLLEYRDGLRAAVLMANEWVIEGASAFHIFAGRIQGQNLMTKIQMVMQPEPPYAHFVELMKAADYMIQNFQTPWPVERTLLTTGVLDSLMQSRAQGGQRLETPQLAVSYQAVDWPFSTGPLPARVMW